MTFGGLLGHDGLRTRRIAKQGRVMVGRVTGRIRTMWQSKRQSTSRVVIETELGGEPIHAESMETFPASEAEG